ncbi:MAG: ribosomal protein [Planctomycetota bacterium]|jgi:small subunit ribosomal protein S1
MSTDPNQTEATSAESEALILQAAAAQQAAALGDPVPAESQPASEEAVAAMGAVVTEDAESAAARIRERMAAATDAIPQPDPKAAAPKERRSGSVEIPAVDELESTLAEQIATMQSEDTSVPVSVGQEEPAAEGESGGAVKSVGSGSKVKGTVQAIHGGEVFLDAGLRQNVVLQITQFAEGKQPSVGDVLDVIIDAEDADGLIKGRIPRARHRAGGNWEALAVGQVVDCMVTAVNKGGLQVSVSNLRGFLPASQVEMGFAGELEQYVGQKLSVQITEVNPKKRNLVVSRRALLQAERAEGEGSFWAQVEVGQDYTGTVKTLKDYGAFINIGPVDGFLHIGEISWARINHPRDVLAEGQQIEVKILKLDQEKKRISLGLKQMAQNPWANAAEKYAKGNVVTGTVSRLAEFGAFVELEAGLEGMVHISELAWRRVGSVGEILKVGDSREFQVVEVDPKRKRVSLSVKALEKRPEPPRAEKPAEEPEATSEESRKPRNTNLRGGTGTAAGGRGLFGNPNDFS